MYELGVYVRSRSVNDTAINNFRDELSEIDISSLLNAILATDPVTDYEKIKEKCHQSLW